MADVIDRDEFIRSALEVYQRAVEKANNTFKDWVHVVRCKDCEMFDNVISMETERGRKKTMVVCRYGYSTRPEGFCHMAKRRREDGKAD